LVLKTSGAGFSHMEKDRILDKLDQIYKMVRDEGFNGKLPSVYLLNGELDETEMNTLYNHPKVKAMVNFSHGEGYNLSLSEFAVTGKPIIASNYSGHLDFLNPEFCILLPGQLIPIDQSAANEWIPKEGQWFAINYQYAGKVISHVYENYEKHLEKSRKLPKFVRDNFSLDKMTERLDEIMEKYTANTPKQMTLKLPQLKKY
jgi:glycosyltransferase involved in cell wall biosynthesis